MKLYKEAMRRLGLVGLTFLAVSVILTAILCVSGAGAAAENRIDSVFDLLPTLTVFAYAGGLAFAYVGFSFLNKRADSDFYHSMPVRRSALYVANTLAALTWTAATVILSVLASLVAYLFVGTPFVPAYYPLAVPFFIVATMLVYAAAAIGMSLTGTLFTNIVMTGVVLFLPRFILFMIGRTIVAGVDIVGWWDLMGLLNPRTNIATGLIVMTRRSFLGTDFVTLPNILYSLLLAVVEIALGGLLFVKRPSELAERGAKNSKLQTLFACLLTLPVLLVMLRYVMGIRKLTVAILIVASLVIYLGYQAIVLRNGKRVAKTLPWYLCTMALSFAAFFGMRAVNTSVMHTSPAASEIKTVQFGTPEPEWGNATYNDLLVADIVFDEDEVKTCVATYLQNAVERLRATRAGEYYNPNRTFEMGVSNSIIPVKITLNNGRVIRRTIEFTNMNTLNEARNRNGEYMAAIRAFPNAQEACYTTAQTYGENPGKADSLKIRDCYFDEMTKKGAIASDAHQIQPVYKQTGRYYNVGDDQGYGTVYVSGYHGTHRYYQYYDIELATPKTAALWMQLNNQKFGADCVKQAQDKYAEIHARAENNSQYFVNFTMTNVPMQDGTKQQIGMGYNTYYYNGAEQSRDVGGEYVEEMLKLLSKGRLSSDPTALNVALYGNAYFESDRGVNGDAPHVNFGACYIAFAPEDEAKLLTLMRAWNEAEAERERVYNPDYAVPDIASAE